MEWVVGRTVAVVGFWKFSEDAQLSLLLLQDPSLHVAQGVVRLLELSLADLISYH
jgi:hypothetical protein